MVNRPHPLAWCVGGILVIGLLVALTAATEFEDFKSENDAHLARVETAIDELNERVERLESTGH